MKIALTDGERILNELIFELAAVSDVRFEAITEMAFAALNTPAPFTIESQME